MVAAHVDGPNTWPWPVGMHRHTFMRPRGTRLSKIGNSPYRAAA